MLSATEYARLRASDRRVIVLKEMAPDEAAALYKALAEAPPTPAAQALDYLMSDDDETASGVDDVPNKA